jgi:hypothetical protein
MEDWLSELFFPPAETEQQKYERKVAAARAAQERRRDPPRNELDRAGRAIGQFFETPAPPWYDDPEVFATLSQAEKEMILAQEMKQPDPRLSPVDRAIRGGIEGLGAMFKGRSEPSMGERVPEPGSWRGPVYDAAIARRMDSETKRLDMEMELLGQLVRSLEPSRKSKYSRENAAQPAPPGFGSATMPYYSEFEGESWTDPEVQREMEERRFQQMMLIRNRPLNTLPE